MQSSTPPPPSLQDQALSTVQSNEHVAQAKAAASSLRAKANQLRDPNERQRMLQAAYERELAAHGDSKLARRLQSGAWQGAAGGAGIGGGVALGLGATVGTLVGGVVAVPTTALGGIIGTGVGAIHGPWFTFDSKKNGKAGQPDAEQAQAAEVAGEQGEMRSKAELMQIRSHIDAKHLEEVETGESIGQRRKPRKLESRRGSKIAPNGVDNSLQLPSDSPARRKPRKLEVRSGTTIMES